MSDLCSCGTKAIAINERDGLGWRCLKCGLSIPARIVQLLEAGRR